MCTAMFEGGEEIPAAPAEGETAGGDGDGGVSASVCHCLSQTSVSLSLLPPSCPFHIHERATDRISCTNHWPLKLAAGHTMVAKSTTHK